MYRVEHEARNPLGAAFATSHLRARKACECRAANKQVRVCVSSHAPAAPCRTNGSALRRKRTVLCRDLEENLMG
jgi:hypothetical protein